jgi:hypothetical protein
VIRRETFCGGRLVKETAQVDVSTGLSGKQYVDGPWTWQLDGEEVAEPQAEAFRAAWSAA